MAWLAHGLLILMGISYAAAVFPYHGKLLQNGWGANADTNAGLMGDIYIVDSGRFQVIGFSFSNTVGTGAAFLLGTTQTYAQVRAGNGRDSSATVIANPEGQLAALRAYSAEDVLLSLPDGMSITDYKYIAVGDIATKRLYGGAEIPNDLVAPAPKNIGTFTTRAHQVSSGTVTVLDDRTIKVRSFSYDGQGPDAFFYVGTSNNVRFQNPPYGIIPDENGVSDTKAGRYNRKDIVLTLPDTISATDIKWLSMYCITYDHNFGEVTFPNRLNVPPYVETGMTGNQSTINCEPLSDRFQVSWSIVGDDISLALTGKVDRDGDYMAFGLSGSDNTYRMTGADVVVVDYINGRSPRAIDYYLSARAQCSVNGGACPDASNSGTNNVVLLSGEVNKGITKVSYSRPLLTDDDRDKEYKTDGTPQQIVWGIGPLNSVDTVAKHYSVAEGGRISASKTIDFGRAVVDNCPIIDPGDKVDLPPFKPHHVYGRTPMTFNVEIGQSASEQGYKALTGLPSWGIAWYVNGVLIPELHLQRGVSYTFRVGGGNDRSQPSKYHPLYFTDSLTGGYEQDSQGTIYQARVGGQLADFAVGDYCEWKVNITADENKIYNCFEELKNDMYLDCDNDPSGYTNFVFTPSASTPDLIYYQCYTHKNLGWRIHVYDALPAVEIPDQDCTASTGTPPTPTTPDPCPKKDKRLVRLCGNNAKKIKCNKVTLRMCLTCTKVRSRCCNRCHDMAKRAENCNDTVPQCQNIRRDCTDTTTRNKQACKQSCKRTKKSCCETCCDLNLFTKKRRENLCP